MKRIILVLFFLNSLIPLLLAQGEIKGLVQEVPSGEPIIFGTVALYQNDTLITEKDTDFNGFYSISGISPGKYDVVFSYTGYGDFKVTDVIIAENKTTDLNAKMPYIDLEAFWGSCSSIKPMVQIRNLTQGFSFNKKQISKIAF
ncbi:MAG: carboxypeptidase-like regulatory domain-containing protein [Bacteroidota bacterium]